MSSSKGKSNIQSKVMARKVVSEFSLCNFFVRTGLLLIKLLVLFVLQWLSVWSIAGTSTKAQTGVSPICTCTFAATRFWQKAIKLIFCFQKDCEAQNQDGIYFFLKEIWFYKLSENSKCVIDNAYDADNTENEDSANRTDNADNTGIFN